MSPRTGRPKIENPMSERLTIRVSNEQADILKAYCAQEEIDKATAIRRGIDKLKDDLKK